MDRARRTEPHERSGYCTRPISDFQRSAGALQRTLKNTGLSALPLGSFCLYGSALRALWSMEQPQDINVAVLDPVVRGQLAVGGGPLDPRVRLAPGVVTSPEALLDSADFTVAQVVYHAGQLLHAERFFEHLGQRLLKLHRVAAPVSTLARTYKFVARGFYISCSDFLRLVRAVQGESRVTEPDLAHDAGGVMVPR